MPFNLIKEPWLPVLRLSGAAQTIAPHEVTRDFDHDPVLALDFPRPDWNAAVTEWLIGVVSVAFPPKSSDHWAELWRSPPPPEQLQEAFATIAFAFDLDGEGPRCFQEFGGLPDAKKLPISFATIGEPWENTIELNKDLFVKRREKPITAAQAAAALISLQTFGPAGGPGYRTSVRGSTAYSVLAWPIRKSHKASADTRKNLSTLWDVVWSNASSSSVPLDDHQLDWSKIFAWLKPTRTSLNDEVYTPEMSHPLHAFFGMPWRMWLHFNHAGQVEACSKAPHGMNYVGWIHTLSAYKHTPGKPPLAFLPPHGLGKWRDWPALFATSPDTVSKAAKSVTTFLEDRLSILDRGEVRGVGAKATGFLLDNAKALSWLEHQIPFATELSASASSDRQLLIAKIIAAADVAVNSLRLATRLALYGVRTKQSKAGHEKWLYALPKGVKRTAGVDPAPEFWANTESVFRKALEGFDAAGGDPEKKVRLQFVQALKKEAKAIFDRYADPETFADGNPERTLQALSTLLAAFAPWGKVAAGMDVAIAKPPKPRKAAR